MQKYAKARKSHRGSGIGAELTCRGESSWRVEMEFKSGGLGVRDQELKRRRLDGRVECVDCVEIFTPHALILDNGPYYRRDLHLEQLNTTSVD